MTRGKTIILTLGAFLWASAAFGEGPPLQAVLKGAPSPALASAETATWSGEAEAGFVATNGNTKTRSASTRLTIKRSGPRWDNRLSADYLSASDAGRTTAERATASFESHYLLSARDYLFAIARYDADRFSGYARQLSEAAGYGRRFPFSSDTTLETEVGAGARQVRLSDGGKKKDAILRLAARFMHRFGKASEFKEEAFSEVSSDNTHTESTMSLKAKIDGNLSLKAAFTTTHNSRVPTGVEKTDTISLITLVLDFGS